MLTIGTMPILLKIVAKLDIAPVIERLKGADIFVDSDGAKSAISQLTKEKIGLLGAEIITDIAPQLGKIADDLPLLVATYKDIPLEAAKKLDAAVIINEFINDEGILTFFKRAFAKKAEQDR